MAANSHSIDLEASSSQYLSIADASQTGLDITGDISISAWVKIESTGAQYALVSKWKSTGNLRSYDLFILPDGKIEFLYSQDGTFTDYTQTRTDSALITNTGVWYHVVVTADVSAADVTIYVDNSSVAVTDFSTNATAIYNSTTAFEIGRRELGSNHFDGLIDEVVVTSDVLTTDEISNLYGGSDASEILDNIQGYWKLNNALTDSSGNGNTLTNNGSAVFSTTVPFTDYAAVATGGGNPMFFSGGGVTIG